MERCELDQNFDIIVKAPCCAKRCLISRLSLREALELVRGCFEEVKSYLIAYMVVGNN